MRLCATNLGRAYESHHPKTRNREGKCTRLCRVTLGTVLSANISLCIGWGLVELPPTDNKVQGQQGVPIKTVPMCPEPPTDWQNRCIITTNFIICSLKLSFSCQKLKLSILGIYPLTSTHLFMDLFSPCFCNEWYPHCCGSTQVRVISSAAFAGLCTIAAQGCTAPLALSIRLKFWEVVKIWPHTWLLLGCKK